MHEPREARVTVSGNQRHGHPPGGGYRYRGTGHDVVEPEACSCGDLGGCAHAREARKTAPPTKTENWKDALPKWWHTESMSSASATTPA